VVFTTDFCEYEPIYRRVAAERSERRPSEKRDPGSLVSVESAKILWIVREALRPFPEARAAVVDALDALDRGQNQT
jgi:hypothetical protein